MLQQFLTAVRNFFLESFFSYMVHVIEGRRNELLSGWARANASILDY